MRRAYFYCYPDADVYQDDVVNLATGLRELGFALDANYDYWRTDPAAHETLLRRTADAPLPGTELVVSSCARHRAFISDSAGGFREVRLPFPPELFRADREYRVICQDFDDAHGGRTWEPEFAQFDVILRAKFNHRCFHPANHQPSALGLSERMLALTRHAPPWRERQATILVNFGASHPFAHRARDLGTACLAQAAPQFALDTTRDDLSQAPADPYDALMWRQTQHCHHRAYYERLGQAQAVAAFCGDLIPGTPAHPTYLVGGRRAQLERAWHRGISTLAGKPDRLVQWDSWRLWEAFAAGCLVYHLDLAYYGAQLPVMPEPFVHYVPIRLDRPEEAATRLQSDPSLAERIAAQGRAWALQHYSPRAQAARALAACGLAAA